MSWTEPNTPNGIITEYILYSVSNGSTTFLTNSSSPGTFVVSDLQPFTEYSFLVEVCTVAGCTESAVGSGFTEESGELFGEGEGVCVTGGMWEKECVMGGGRREHPL